MVRHSEVHVIVCLRNPDIIRILPYPDRKLGSASVLNYAELPVYI